MSKFESVRSSGLLNHEAALSKFIYWNGTTFWNSLKLTRWQYYYYISFRLFIILTYKNYFNQFLIIDQGRTNNKQNLNDIVQTNSSMEKVISLLFRRKDWKLASKPQHLALPNAKLRERARIIVYKWNGNERLRLSVCRLLRWPMNCHHIGIIENLTRFKNDPYRLLWLISYSWHNTYLSRLPLPWQNWERNIIFVIVVRWFAPFWLRLRGCLLSIRIQEGANIDVFHWNSDSFSSMEKYTSFILLKQEQWHALS